MPGLPLRMQVFWATGTANAATELLSDVPPGDERLFSTLRTLHATLLGAISAATLTGAYVDRPDSCLTHQRLRAVAVARRARAPDARQRRRRLSPDAAARERRAVCGAPAQDDRRGREIVCAPGGAHRRAERRLEARRRPDHARRRAAGALRPAGGRGQRCARGRGT